MIMKGILLSVLVSLTLAGKCFLDPVYEAQIEKDFLTFKDGITPEMMNKLRQADLPQKCPIKITKGVASSKCDDYFGYEPFRAILNSFSHEFPDMQFVLTTIDDPNVYKNTCNNTFEDPLRTCNCAEDYEKFPEHSYFKRTKVTKFFEKIPVFAHSVMPGCTNDILVPSYYHLVQKQIQNVTQTPWQQRQFKAFWRGTVSDIFSNPSEVSHPADYSHRINIVRKTKDIPDCDIKLSNYYTMPEPWLTEAFKAQYPLGEKVEQSSLHKYKILVDIDGASFSERFPKLFKQGAAVFKLKVFDDIGSVAMIPWEHYIPIKMDLSDFREKLEWAKRNDEELRKIAERGMKRSKEVHSHSMYKCYIWHVLKKYESLLRKGGAI